MDILTEFCSSSDEVKVYRLSFSEYYYATGIDKFEDWDESHIYGGMPFLLEKQTSKQKSRYLEYVINKVYISDIDERKKIKNPWEMDSIVNFYVVRSFSYQSK